MPDAQGLTKFISSLFRPPKYRGPNHHTDDSDQQDSDPQETTSTTSSTPDSHSISVGNSPLSTATKTTPSASPTTKMPTTQTDRTIAPIGVNNDTPYASQTYTEIIISTITTTIDGSLATVTSTFLPTTFTKEVAESSLLATASFSSNNTPDSGLETHSINSADAKETNGKPQTAHSDKGINVGGVAAGGSLGLLFLALVAFLLFRLLGGKSQSTSPVGPQERHLSAMQDLKPSSDPFRRFSPKALPIHKESLNSDLEHQTSQIGMAF